MSALQGRVALVTGASGGIGRAVAAALSAEGAAVCLTGRDTARLSQAAFSCSGADVTVRAADLTVPEAAGDLLNHVTERFGRLDVLVHCAAVLAFGRTEDVPVADLDAQLAANVSAPYALTRKLLPALIESQGDIVFLNSSITRFPRAGTGQYAITKFALLGFADSLRQEVNEQGVRVLSVFPGRTATSRQKEIFESEGRTYDPARLLQPEDVAATIVHAVTLPRTAEITELHIRPMLKS